jgi:hypothetical protein
MFMRRSCRVCIIFICAEIFNDINRSCFLLDAHTHYDELFEELIIDLFFQLVYLNQEVVEKSGGKISPATRKRDVQVPLSNTKIHGRGDAASASFQEAGLAEVIPAMRSI